VKDQKPLGLDRDLNYFSCHVPSLLVRCVTKTLKKLFLRVEGFGL
jgi:hypothetical protein